MVLELDLLLFTVCEGIITVNNHSIVSPVGYFVSLGCYVMGGHSAWRKRVEAGELAKGRGGAIARHRPHFGRKGEDLKLNRKGNIAGGNPKKSKSTKSQLSPQDNMGTSMSQTTSTHLFLRRIALTVLLAFLSVSVSAGIYGWFIHNH